MLFRSGRLPTSILFGEQYFCAPEHLDPGEQEGLAESYANLNGQRLYIEQNLPVEVRDHNLFVGAVMNIFFQRSEYCKEVLVPQGYSWLEFEALCNKAEQARKGVLLGFSEEIATDFVLDTSNEDSAEYSFVALGGLSIAYLSGIEPLGDYEWNVMTTLQDALH